MFNINSRQLNDTTILHLVDPSTGLEMYADEAETQPLQVEIYGRSSKQFRNWVAAASRKQEAQKNKNKKKTLEEQMDDTAEYLATITKSISNFDMDGKPLDCHEAYKELYSNPALVWIGEQVSEKLGELDNFLQK